MKKTDEQLDREIEYLDRMEKRESCAPALDVTAVALFSGNGNKIIKLRYPKEAEPEILVRLEDIGIRVDVRGIGL